MRFLNEGTEGDQKMEINQERNFHQEVILVNEKGEPEIIRMTEVDFDVNDLEDLEPGPWQYSEVPYRAAILTLEDVMMEQAGYVWTEGQPQEDMTLDGTLELLSKHCYVQLSRLLLPNIKACLKNDGSVVAYCPEKTWHHIFGKEMETSYEVSGYRTIGIHAVGEERLVFSDHQEPEGQFKELDFQGLQLLSQSGWMLEVYK